MGASGGLGIIGNPQEVNLSILDKNSNWMSYKVTSLKSNVKFLLINIYGPIPSADKISVWREISTFLFNHPEMSVFIGGDFNAIMEKEEKFGAKEREKVNAKKG